MSNSPNISPQFYLYAREQHLFINSAVHMISRSYFAEYPDFSEQDKRCLLMSPDLFCNATPGIFLHARKRTTQLTSRSYRISNCTIDLSKYYEAELA